MSRRRSPRWVWQDHVIGAGHVWVKENDQWQRKRVPAGVTRLCAYLARWMDKQLRCWRPRAQMMRDLGVSEKTVKRWIQASIALGFLERIEGGYRGKVTVYQGRYALRDASGKGVTFDPSEVEKGGHHVDPPLQVIPPQEVPVPEATLTLTLSAEDRAAVLALLAERDAASVHRAPVLAIVPTEPQPDKEAS